jgi:hypothetical protein
MCRASGRADAQQPVSGGWQIKHYARRCGLGEDDGLPGVVGRPSRWLMPGVSPARLIPSFPTPASIQTTREQDSFVGLSVLAPGA